MCPRRLCCRGSLWPGGPGQPLWTTWVRAGLGRSWGGPWEASEMTVGLKGDVHLQRCPQSLNHSLREQPGVSQAPHHLGLGAQTPLPPAARQQCGHHQRGPYPALRHNCRSEFNDAIVISNRSVSGISFYVPTSLPHYSVSATQVGLSDGHSGRALRDGEAV